MRALGDVRFRPLRDDQEQESFEQQLLPLKRLVYCSGVVLRCPKAQCWGSNALLLTGV